MMKDPTAPGGSERARRPRLPRILLILAIALAVPTIAYASHQFSDVPTSNPFHANIGNLVNSGITAGCGSGRYCPRSAVTREQMAAFLNRGLGRVAWNADEITFAESVDFYAAYAGLQTGGAGGGTGFIRIDGSVTAYTEVAGLCPCTVYAYLFDDTSGELLWANATTISDESASGFRAASTSLGSVVAQPSGASNNYGLAVEIETTGVVPTDDTALVSGELSVEYFPFGPAGGSTLGATSDTPIGPIGPDAGDGWRPKPAG